MRPERLLASGAAAVAVAVAIAVAAPAIAGSPPAGQDPVLAPGSEPGPILLLERSPCYGEGPTVTPPAPTAPNQAQITFVLPPTTRIRTDAGVVVAASTNTGCRPRPSDVVVLESGERAPAAVADAVVRCARTGDWRTPGAWVDLAC